MKLESNVPSGPLEKKWDKHRFEMKLVNPANKRKYTVIMVGIGPGGRRRRRVAGRARLPGQVLLLPGLAPPRALDRRAGRHQRRQELPQRRRLASTASSTTRSRAATSAPARPTSTASPRSRATSSTSASRRAFRSRASTAGCSTTAPSAAPRSRARSTRAARPGSSCCSAPTRRSSARSASAQVEMFTRHEMLELIVVDGRARGIVVRDMVTGELETHMADAVVPGDRRLRQRLLSRRPTPRAATRRRSGARTRRAPRSPIPASRRSTRPASRSPATTSRS